MAEFENGNLRNFFPNNNKSIFTIKFQMNSGSTLEILGFTLKIFLKKKKTQSSKQVEN